MEEDNPVKDEPMAANDAVDETPTVEQARPMFIDNPWMASVLTTEGYLLRDGSVVVM